MVLSVGAETLTCIALRSSVETHKTDRYIIFISDLNRTNFGLSGITRTHRRIIVLVASNLRSNVQAMNKILPFRHQASNVGTEKRNAVTAVT